MTPLRVQPLGDTALRIELGQGIDPELHRRVRAACVAVERAGLPGVVECVPAYSAVTVHYRPTVVRFGELREALETALAGVAALEPPPGRQVTIPVVYDGPDLAFVAEHHGISVADVIALHSGPEYLVYMIGFAPGFPYLGGLPGRLATPRLEKPRVSVPAGSVGIGGAQTGIYPVEGPGGWRLIGRTSAVLYDPKCDPASLLAAGDRVRFEPRREG